MLTPMLIVPLAHARSSVATRFGTAALTAGKNGDSVAEARKARVNNESGDLANASPPKHAAPNRSDAIITRRRLNRSPSDPARGVSRPSVANDTSSVPAIQREEPVRRYTSHSSAVMAAWLPMREI